MIACALTLTALALGALRSTEAQGLRSGLLAGDVPQRSVGRVPFSTRSLSQMFDSGDDNGDDEADDDAGGDDDVAPAPASIGTDVPLSYFGAPRRPPPMCSATCKRSVGPRSRPNSHRRRRDESSSCSLTMIIARVAPDFRRILCRRPQPSECPGGGQRCYNTCYTEVLPAHGLENQHSAHV